MRMPLVSVILPVFNAEKYIRECMDSLLRQSYSNLEIIVVNDGSQDHSVSIIESFKDDRIKLYHNEKNSGLIFTLNRAIELSNGEFIARMDSDDICLPNRIEEQVKILMDQPLVQVVATTIQFMDEKGLLNGYWEEDQKCLTNFSIHSFLPKNNCIAHPTVMYRSATIRKYLYDERQKNSEDYDLWLRMANDKIQFYKIKEPLLLYRVHSQSITQTTNENVFWKIAHTKYRFSMQAIQNQRISGFVLNTLFFCSLDFIKGFLKSTKKLLSKCING